MSAWQKQWHEIKADIIDGGYGNQVY